MKTIRARLTLRLLAGFALLLGAGGAALFLGVRAALIDEFDRGLASKAAALATLTEFDRGKVKIELSDEMLPEFARGRRGAYFELRNADGQVIQRSASLDPADLPVAGLPPADLALPDGAPGRAIALTFTPRIDEDESPAPRPPAKVTLVVALDRSALAHTLAIVATGTAGVGLFMMLSAVLFAMQSIRRALAPLDELGQRVAAIGADSLASRLPAAALPAELRPIAERLNDLLARLGSAFERERRFSNDVAHELRTPIAELRALAELAIKWPPEKVEATPAFHDALAIAGQMEGIVNGLLAIARCEGDAPPMPRQAIALAPLARELWQTHTDLVQRRALTTAFHVPAEFAAHGDPALLRSVLANLLANAAEYATPGSAVQISAAAAGDRVIFTVSNVTAQLTPTDLPHLFERFWRKDAARTASLHAGLGLAITRAAARMLGGDVSAEFAEPGMVAFHATLPAVAPLASAA